MVEPRPDGRNRYQLRPLACTRGLLNRAHGSARWSQENTIVLAAVYGPKSVSGRQENAERATVEVVWKSKSGVAGNFEKEAEVILRRTLEYIILATQHPNTGISVIVQVVNDDGSVLACAVNACVAALVDASIPLSGLVNAVCCGVTGSGEVVLDPTKAEEQALQAQVFLVLPSQATGLIPQESTLDAVVTSTMRGATTADCYLDCLASARAACKVLAEFSRNSIGQKQLQGFLMS